MIPFDDVLITHQLDVRPTRPADFAADVHSVLAIVNAMMNRPGDIFQELVDEALRRCKAGSAGISLLEAPVSPSEQYFRWVATAGRMESFAGGTMPRQFSPCGSVIDANELMLIQNPSRYFMYISNIPVPVHEVLLVPFYSCGKPIGTLWVVSHGTDREFDREDARVVSSLSHFAAIAADTNGVTETRLRIHNDAREAAERKLAVITEQRRKLEEADGDKVAFLATLAHELRNTLAPILYAAQVMQIAESKDNISKAHSILERQILQIRRLVDDLMDFVRLSSDQPRLECGTVSLNRLLTDSVESSRGCIERAGQRVQYAPASSDSYIWGDDVRLAQVFTNLLANAAKYGRPGGLVDVTLNRDGKFAVISIKDDGIGIEASMLARVFDVFFQVESSVNRSQGGLGIGLALVKRLVETHGGHISARSEGLGKGSEFIVALPLLNAPRTALMPTESNDWIIDG